MGTKTLHLPASALTGGVALPSRAENEVLREQADMLEQLEDVTGSMLHYTRELQHRFDDPYLKVVLAHSRTTVEGVKPNYYHVVRMEPGKPSAVLVLEDEETGEWRDLGDWVFDYVARSDLQNDRTQRLLHEERIARERERIRQKQREGQDRAREFDDRLWHATHTSISIPRSIS